jgi:hypothetical protein
MIIYFCAEINYAWPDLSPEILQEYREGFFLYFCYSPLRLQPGLFSYGKQ